MRIALPTLVAKSSLSDGIDLREYVDNPGERTVTAHVTTLFGSEAYVLWTGAAYDAIGQWTDAQAQARILAIFMEKHGSDTVQITP